MIAALNSIQQSGPATHVQTVTTTTAGISLAGPPPLIPVSQTMTTASHPGMYQLTQRSPFTGMTVTIQPHSSVVAIPKAFITNIFWRTPELADILRNVQLLIPTPPCLESRNSTT